MTFCCESMEYYYSFTKNAAEDSFLSDAIITYVEKFDEYGIIIHDGGESFIEIQYCPWCGKELPASKREQWFAELEKLGFDSPSEEDIPEKYQTGAWYQE